MLKINDIQFRYLREKELLRNISLEVEKGEIVAILGASGSGKSTLLKLIAGLLPLQKGEILLDSKDISRVDCHLREVGLVFQDYALFPHLNVEKNIGFSLKKSERNQVTELLNMMRLAGYQKKYPHQLSGGEKQRVAIARALAAKPKILLLDEPFSNLDEALKEELRIEMASLLKKSHCTTIMVTHDKRDAYAIADRLLYMDQGSFVKEERIR